MGLGQVVSSLANTKGCGLGSQENDAFSRARRPFSTTTGLGLLLGREMRCPVGRGFKIDRQIA